jgi:hypothetical protein
MKKKILIAALSLILPFSVLAGTVKTKDDPDKKCGGYHDGSYHLKCKNEKTAKNGYVERDHKWHNPFSGFTKGNENGKAKQQNSMPTDSPHH